MFGRFFTKRPKRSVGLDIGTHYIKISELVEKKGKFCLNAFGIERLVDNSREGKIAAIKKLVQENHISINKVNASICGPSVIVRYILFPQMTKDQLDSAKRYEAEKYIPFNIEDVILSAPILEEQREDNKIRALVVAAKKTFIEDYVKLVADCGLKAELIDVDSFALINSFLSSEPQDQSKGIVALLHIGSEFTNINILKDRVSHFMRDINTGGREITKMLSEKLNIDIDDAENLKCNPGEREEEINALIAPALNNLLGEISLSFSYYEDQLESGIDKVFLSGGTSKLKNLSKFLSSNLGVEVVTWDPTINLEISQELNQEKLKSCLPMLSLSIGLALSSPDKA